MRNVNHKLILQAHILLKSFLSKFLNSFYFLLFQASVHFHPSNFLSSFLPTCDGITNETVGMYIYVWAYLFQRKVYTDVGTCIHTCTPNLEHGLWTLQSISIHFIHFHNIHRVLSYIFIINKVSKKYSYLLTTTVFLLEKNNMT